MLKEYILLISKALSTSCELWLSARERLKKIGDKVLWDLEPVSGIENDIVSKVND